jgi:hypothetical protein
MQFRRGWIKSSETEEEVVREEDEAGEENKEEIEEKVEKDVTVPDDGMVHNMIVVAPQR